MKPDLHHLLAYTQQLHALADRQLLYVSEHEYLPVDGRQIVQGTIDDLANFPALERLWRDLPPVGKVPGRKVVVRVLAGFKLLILVVPPAAALQPRFVHGNLQQPRLKLFHRTQLLQTRKNLDHRFLGGVLGIGLIPKHGEGSQVNSAFIRPHQLVKEFSLSPENSPDQVLFFRRPC